MLKFDAKKKGYDRSKLVKDLANNRILVPYLDKAFVGFEDRWTFTYEPKLADSAWHPSGHCTPSVTELYQGAEYYYDYYSDAPSTAAAPSSPARMQKAFMVGHYWHQLLQYVVVEKLGFAGWDQIERSGKKRWADGPFGWVSGSGDIVPLKAPNGWEGIVDIKTMNLMAFKEQGLPSAFAEKYICQMNIYMDLFDQEQALILGVNKNDGSFKELTFVRNDALITAIYDKWYYVKEALDSGVPPTEQDDLKFTLPEVR